MSIELVRFTQSCPPNEGQWSFHLGSVVHFGTAPPPEKENSVVLDDPEVAEHHAKLFWNQGRFWLDNLSGLPCTVLKASGRAVPLTALGSYVEIEQGESFQIGSVMFRIERLDSPMDGPPGPPSLHDSRLASELRPGMQPLCLPSEYVPDHPITWRAVLRLTHELSRYTQAEEMWLRTLDTMILGFQQLLETRHTSVLASVAALQPGRFQLQSPVPVFGIPSCKCPPGDSLGFAKAAGLPADLPQTVASLVLHEREPQVFRWTPADSSDTVTILAGRVLLGNTPAGALMVVIGGTPGAAAELGERERYLFAQLLSQLSLALSFLDERRRAMAFERLYDLGSATERMTHDESHVIVRAEQELNDLHRILSSACTQCERQGPALLHSVKKAQMIARQVRGTARAILRFSRQLERSAAAHQKNWIQLTECREAVRDWFQQVQQLNNDGELGFGLQYDLEQQPFYADCDLVLSALRNLQINAVRSFTSLRRETGQYQVQMLAAVRREPLSYVVLTVADNGAGMSPRMASQVFRGRVADSCSGHGLGSQIVRWVMDQHQGLIRFATAEQQGTVVELWFPQFASLDPPEDAWRPYTAHRGSAPPVVVLDSHELFEKMTVR